MSVETPEVQETSPVVTKPVGHTTENEVSAAPPSEPVTTAATTEPVKETTGTTPAVETTKDEAVVEATPATEGTLGYKAPGLLKQFRFVKHFFWFNEKAITKEALESYIKSEKADVAHHNAAWAQETGKGVLFYAKRAEDKATPSGMILLPEATSVTKVGANDFSFKLGSHTHKFEASSRGERDSWVVAIEKIVSESKELKAEVTGRESYKKTVEGYSFSLGVIAGSTTSPIKSDSPKKSLDVNTPTAAATTDGATEAETAPAVHEVKHTKEAEKQAKKERSQSRKRNSVFGLFGKKDEEKELKKEEKAEKQVEKEHLKDDKKVVKEHEKAEKEAEKEHVKEEKKIEAEHKKEEAKAEHDAVKAKEAAEATTVAAAPAAAVMAAEKKEENHEEVTTPTEKKSKRASVFGGFFNKNKVTSPSAEKSEREVGPVLPAKDETLAVSETAPKLDEPIDTKPIDAAAVTAPVDAPETVTPVPAAATYEDVEPVAPVETTTTPKTEKKSFLAGFMKKHDKKEEAKPEKSNEEAVKEIAPVAAATEPTAVDPTAETPVKEIETPKEERPAREKRRTSLFGSLGTLKRKTEKSPEPSSVGAEDVKSPDTKREKSPLPSKLGGLFRKPSRAIKTENPNEEAKTDIAATTEAQTANMTETPATTETPANATTVEPTDSKIADDVVPHGPHSTVHDTVTMSPAEVKATV